jgi:hypothetical protein
MDVSTSVTVKVTVVAHLPHLEGFVEYCEDKVEDLHQVAGG